MYSLKLNNGVDFTCESRVAFPDISSSKMIDMIFGDVMLTHNNGYNGFVYKKLWINQNPACMYMLRNVPYELLLEVYSLEYCLTGQDFWNHIYDKIGSPKVLTLIDHEGELYLRHPCTSLSYHTEAK